MNRLVESIEDAQKGLDPRILSFWYQKIEKEAREACPSEELRNSIRVIQNPDLPMKFQLKASKRAIPFIVQTIDRNSIEMPFATRLYFEKFLEILQQEAKNFGNRNGSESNIQGK